MFAIIKTGGKQYKVTAGDIIAVEKLAAEAGSDIDLDQVLMIGDGATMTMGNPLVAGAVVAATVVEQTKGDKVIVFKKKRRQNYRRRRGHRQLLTILKISDIVPPGGTRKAKPAAEAKPKAAPKVTEAKKEAKAAHKEPKKTKPAAAKAKGRTKEKK